MDENRYEGRTRAERRHTDWAKAIRKKRLSDSTIGNLYLDGSEPVQSYYDNLHQYSKNKIHCSCGMCRAKTKNKGPKKRRVHGNYEPSYNPTANEIRTNNLMDSQVEEYYEEC